MDGAAFEQGTADNGATSRANRVIPDVLDPVGVGVAACRKMERVGFQLVDEGKVCIAKTCCILGDGIKHGPKVAR
jgi:hypothetical protein